MSFGIQTCVRCGKTEEGHTGPADRYLCIECYRAGHRQDSFGQVIENKAAPWPPIIGRIESPPRPYTDEDHYGEGRS